MFVKFKYWTLTLKKQRLKLIILCFQPVDCLCCCDFSKLSHPNLQDDNISELRMCDIISQAPGRGEIIVSITRACHPAWKLLRDKFLI